MKTCMCAQMRDALGRQVALGAMGAKVKNLIIEKEDIQGESYKEKRQVWFPP